MRRSSIITTILLVIVIVGLVVALVVTNLPEKQEVANPDNNEQVVGEENVGDEKEEETPTYVALDSDIAKRMANILYPHELITTIDYFYDSKVECKTIEDFENGELILIAFYKSAIDKVQPSDDPNYKTMLKKSDLDTAIKEIFGDVEYTPEDFIANFNGYEYIEEKETFYHLMGGGGGADAPEHSITGVYKIEEYSDRYEVYSKYLFVTAGEAVVNYGGTKLGYVRSILNWKAYDSNVLARYKDFTHESLYTNVKTLDELCVDMEAKTFAKPQIKENTIGAIEYESRMKILSKYFDDATEYKHTFMKNEDGSYYWVKSEIIK